MPILNLDVFDPVLHVQHATAIESGGMEWLITRLDDGSTMAETMRPRFRVAPHAETRQGKMLFQGLCLDAHLNVSVCDASAESIVGVLLPHIIPTRTMVFLFIPVFIGSEHSPLWAAPYNEAISDD